MDMICCMYLLFNFFFHHLRFLLSWILNVILEPAKKLGNCMLYHSLGCLFWTFIIGFVCLIIPCTRMKLCYSVNWNMTEKELKCYWMTYLYRSHILCMWKSWLFFLIVNCFWHYWTNDTLNMILTKYRIPHIQLIVIYAQCYLKRLFFKLFT